MVVVSKCSLTVNHNNLIKNENNHIKQNFYDILKCFLDLSYMSYCLLLVTLRKNILLIFSDIGITLMPSSRLDNVNSTEFTDIQHRNVYVIYAFSSFLHCVVIVFMHINDVLFMSRILGPKANRVQL